LEALKINRIMQNEIKVVLKSIKYYNNGKH